MTFAKSVFVSENLNKVMAMAHLSRRGILVRVSVLFIYAAIQYA